jgi:hypothetical protein
VWLLKADGCGPLIEVRFPAIHSGWAACRIRNKWYPWWNRRLHRRSFKGTGVVFKPAGLLMCQVDD